MSIEMMFSRSEIRFVRSRSQEIKNIVNLHGIGVHDETASLTSHANGKCRLAAGRRASYQDCIRDRTLIHRRNCSPCPNRFLSSPL